MGEGNGRGEWERLTGESKTKKGKNKKSDVWERCQFLERHPTKGAETVPHTTTDEHARIVTKQANQYPQDKKDQRRNDNLRRIPCKTCTHSQKTFLVENLATGDIPKREGGQQEEDKRRQKKEDKRKTTEERRRKKGGNEEKRDIRK